MTLFNERQIKFKKSLFLIGERAKNALKDASQTILRCDPLVYIEDVNFIQLKYFIRGYVVGIDYLRYPTKTIDLDFLLTDELGECKDYRTNITSPYKFKDTKFQCDGTLHGCWKFELNQICFPVNIFSYDNFI